MSTQVLIMPPPSTLTLDSSAAAEYVWMRYQQPTTSTSIISALAAIPLLTEHDVRQRRKHNATVPKIHALPSELLQMIFALALARSPASHYTQLRALRLVSTHWSDVIAAHCALWTRVSEECSVAEVEMALRLSKAMPLTVAVRSAKHLDAVSKHRARWAELEVFSTDREVVRKWLATSGGARCERLRTLKVLGPPLPGGSDLGQDDEELSVLSAPNLEDLRITGWSSAKWFSPTLMSGLKTLVLMGGGSRAWPEEWSLLHVLRASPELEVLDLTSIEVVVAPSTLEDSPASPTLTPIALPALRKISLRYVSDAIEQLLPHIIIPTSTHVSLARVLYQPHLQPFANAVGEWLQHYTATSTFEDVTTCTRAQLHDSELKISLGKGRGLGPAQVEIELTDYVGGDYVRRVCPHLLSRVKSDEIRKATIVVEGELNFLEELDAAFPAVREVVVDGPGSLVTLKQLARSRHDDRWLVPAMERMTLGRCAPTIGNEEAVEIIGIIEGRKQAAMMGATVVGDIQLAVECAFGEVVRE